MRSRSYAALVFLAACNVFDPTLYQNVQSVQPQAWAAVEDKCPYPDDKLISSDVRNHKGTVLLNGLADDIQDCGKLTGFDGPDGVIGLRLAAAEVVHLETSFVTQPGVATPPIDLGVYIMNSCDPTACATRVERCPPGVGEHFAWSAETPGAYYFGFDTKAYDQTQYAPEVEVSINFPRCGDGELDKGETCDDGDVASLDGCDSACLAELANAGVPPVEVEPNNYYLNSNVVVLAPGETMGIKGQIGGGCDLDFYALDVVEGGFVRITMLSADGSDCPAGTPPFPMELDDPTGAEELGAAKIPAERGGTNYCPVWDETVFGGNVLPAGRYTIELKPYNKGVDTEPFPYTLRVEMLPVQGAGGGGGAGGAGGAGGG